MEENSLFVKNMVATKPRVWSLLALAVGIAACSGSSTTAPEVSVPLMTGAWYVTTLITVVSEGCGGVPVVGELADEQILVVQHGTALDWQVVGGPDRLLGSIKKDGGFNMAPIAGGNREYTGVLAGTGQRMTGFPNDVSRQCYVEGSFLGTKCPTSAPCRER